MAFQEQQGDRGKCENFYLVGNIPSAKDYIQNRWPQVALG